MDVIQEIALRTDAEIEACLQGVFNGLAAQKEAYKRLATSPDDMKAVITAALGAAALPALPEGDAEDAKEARARALRALLVEMAESPELRPRVEAQIARKRDMRFDPITSAILLAGIVMVLSTHIEIEYKNEGGKKNLLVKVVKKPTDGSVLARFFDLFKGA